MRKAPKNDSKYFWTNHVFGKMLFYGLSEQRIKRIIRHPKRIEEGIADGCIAAMQPSDSKKYAEIWTMYKLAGKKIKVITAWRYPGKSPERDPVPSDIMRDIKTLLQGLK